jgi:hypothetical protein
MVKIEDYLSLTAGLISAIAPFVIVFSQGLRKKIYTDTEIKTDNLDDLVRESKCMSEAKRIQICAGELCSTYYNNPKVISYLENAVVKNNASIEIVFGPALYVDNFDFLKLVLLYPNNFTLRKSYQRHTKHFKIITKTDNKKVYFLDRPHEIDELKREGICFKEECSSIDLDSLTSKNFAISVRKSKVIPLLPEAIFKEFSDRNVIARDDGKIEYKGFIKKVGGEIKLAEDSDIERLKEYLFK